MTHIAIGLITPPFPTPARPVFHPFQARIFSATNQVEAGIGEQPVQLHLAFSRGAVIGLLP